MKEKLFEKGITRRLFSVVLALAMVVALVPVTNLKVYAGSGTCGYCGHGADKHRTGDGTTMDGISNTYYVISCDECACAGHMHSWQDCIDYSPHDHNFAEDWTYDDTYHWHSCTGEGHAESCKDAEGAAKATHGDWADGKCGTCGYACTHGEATSGTCSICGKDLDTPAPTPTPSPSPKSEPTKSSEPAKTDIEVREALEETMPVSPVSVDTTQFNKTDAAIIPGGTYNLSNFITIKGIVKGINTAVAASNKSGSNAVTIYSGRPFAFNGEILKAIQAGKKDVTYFFNHDGHLYSVTIPATVDATKVLEKTGFAGPLYVGQQLGTTVLIK